jgi:ubiquinone biosynthesis protein UbiJ
MAMERLRPFAAQAVVLHLAAWPGLLPPAPDLILGVTPAGLFERMDASPAGALRIEVDAANPAQMLFGVLQGQKPGVTVQGDAAFAGAMHWLLDNLRWDVEDDIASLLGPLAARQLGSLGQGLKSALATLAQRFKPGGAA